MSRFNQSQPQQQGQYEGNNYQNQNQGQGWRNNQNQNNQNSQGYGWRNNQNNMPPPRVSEPPPEKKVDLEQALAQMLTSHTAFMNEIKANMQQHATQLNNQATQLRNLEVQMGQMANLLTERQSGSLPSNSEVNPRREGNEHVKAVMLRSGKELEIQEQSPVTEEVETEKVSQPGQNDDADREQSQEKQYVGNTTEAKDNPQPIAIFERTLCDLGASINLMPLSIFKLLGLGEARPTIVTLQLADRSLKHLRGVIEDVLVKVDKFIFPSDFIVLDMEDDKDIPIILGRPFLATGRTMIDVQRGELKLRVQEDEVKFNVFKAVRHPTESDTCFMEEIVEAIVSSQSGLIDPLEASLVQSDYENMSEEAEEYVKWMDSFEPNRRKYFESLGESTKTPVPSVEQPPKMEQKPLPSHLKYAYLGIASTLPVMISASLNELEEEKLLRVLRDHKNALGWSLAYLKGIRPSMCMHRILLEDGHKPSVEAQRRLNPTMKEVV